MNNEMSLPPSTGIYQDRGKLKNDELKELLKGMIQIREFEDKVHQLFMSGFIYGTTHLCQGQESISVGVAKALRDEDYVTTTYRSHGQVLARGLEPVKLFSELMGRNTGISKGKGGSMHFSDFEKNVIGSFGIVGAGLPVALGAGMSAKYKGEDRVSVTFFGDGATNIGAFHESLNMASIFKAPVVFICENNHYGEYSHMRYTTPIEKISIRADSYDMPGVTIDGNNVFTVIEETQKAVERARKGEGPSLIECMTYRHSGHSRTDPAKYRPQKEVEAWLDYDPILLYKEWLIKHDICTRTEMNQMQEKIINELNEATEQAKAAPWPDEIEIMRDIYAD